MTRASPVPALTPVGLIGGMGWESSAAYYRIINEDVRRRFGGTRSVVCRLDSLDFAEVKPLVAAENWRSLTEVLVAAALRLESGGARVLALCSNTAHVVAEAIVAATSFDLLHIADPVARQAADAGVHRLGVLATRPTLDHGVLTSRWRDRFGLVAVAPTGSERDRLNKCIYGRLLTGLQNADDASLLNALAMSLIDRGADAIVLACTDLAGHVDPSALRVPVFDSTHAHARAIASAITIAPS